MRVLALDTALHDCQAAVFAFDGAGLAERLGHAGGPAAGDAEAIVERAADALSLASTTPEEISRVLVTVGPGSFTGVRVGLSFAKGFAAALDIPVLGVTTLEGLARTYGAPSVAVIDARHGAVFAAQFDAEFAMGAIGRRRVEEVRDMADRGGVPLAGPADAVAALGAGAVVDGVDLRALAPVARDDPARRAATARYAVAVDAAPQRHKSLARA